MVNVAVNNDEFVEMVTKGRDEIFGDADKILQYNDELLNEIVMLKHKMFRIMRIVDKGYRGLDKDTRAYKLISGIREILLEGYNNE